MHHLIRRALRLSLCLLTAALAARSFATDSRWLRAGHASEALSETHRLEPEGVWTLERALARAMEANPDVLSARHEFERQEGARWQVRARLLPSMTASAGVNERQEGLVDRPPSSVVHPPSQETAVALYGYDLRLEVRQLVFDGLSSWHQLKRQDLLSSQAFLALRSTVLRIASAVRQGFDAILMRHAVMAAEQRRVEEFAQVVAWTARKHAAGEIAEFELLRAESELQGARAELAESVRLLGQAEQSFHRLLQLPEMARPIQVQGDFLPRRFDMPFEKAVEQARLNRPDVEAAALAVDAAHRNQLSVVGGYLPKVEVFASYGGRTSYYNSGVLLEGWTIGAVGQWNLFDGGMNRGRRISLRAERRAAEIKLAELQHHFVSKLQELYQGLAQTKVAMEAQEKSLDLAARASRDARRLYDVGQTSLEQVLQAEMTHRRAVSRMNEAVFNYNATVAEIELSVGGQLDDSLEVPATWKP